MIGSIVRAAMRDGSPPSLNIILVRSDEQLDAAICVPPHRYWALGIMEQEPWNFDKTKPPPGLTFLDSTLEEYQLPFHIDLDLLVSMRSHWFSKAKKVSESNHVPHLMVFDGPPSPTWTLKRLLREM